MQEEDDKTKGTKEIPICAEENFHYIIIQGILRMFTPLFIRNNKQENDYFYTTDDGVGAVCGGDLDIHDGSKQMVEWELNDIYKSLCI